MYEKKILDMVAIMGSIDDIDEMRRATLDMLRRIVWFDHGIFWIYDPLTDLPRGIPISLDVSHGDLEYYVKYVYTEDQALKAYKNSNQLVIRATDFFNYNKWTNTEYFNLNCRPFYMHYHLNLFIRKGNKILGCLCLSREKSSEDFSTKDLELLETIYPHVLNRLSWQYCIDSLYHRLLSSHANNSMRQREFFRPLTERERDIVMRVLAGYSNKAIVSELGISINTVKMHLKNVFSKLNVKRRSQLMTLYLSSEVPEINEQKLMKN